MAFLCLPYKKANKDMEDSELIILAVTCLVVAILILYIFYRIYQK